MNQDSDDSTAQLLRDAGIQFQRKDDAHLVVYGIGHTFDFCASTGVWSMRGSTQKHSGARSLIKFISGSKIKETT